MGTLKLRSRCPEHISVENFSEKNFLKFSIRLWGRLFETPCENIAAGFSKLYLSCPDGTLKHKYFLFKTFLQDFCEFEQRNFWTFSEFFSGSFVDLTFSVSRLAFWEKVHAISYVIGQKNMWLNKQIVWEIERFSQTSGKIFSTIWSKMLSRSSAEELSGSFSWKKSFFHCLPNIALKILRLSPKSFTRIVKTTFQLSGGKLWGLIQKKDVILANSENWANFFLEFSQTFSSRLSKLLHSSRSEKNIV